MSTRPTPKPLTELLRNASATQQQLVSKAARLQKMQTRLHQLLPTDLAAHVQVANLRGDRLVLTADASAWASRLRYLSTDLLQQLRSDGWRCQRIDIKVAALHAPPPVPKVKRSLSDASRRLLLQTAKHIDNPEIAATLEKLAQHGEPVDKS